MDVDGIRSDIREDRQGVPLRLAVLVQDGGACTPLSDAVVDIWHCDRHSDIGCERTRRRAPWRERIPPTKVAFALRRARACTRDHTNGRRGPC